MNNCVPKNEMIYNEFKEQLVRKGSYYETGLLWKVGHPKLLSNKQGSLARLSNLLRTLNRKHNILKKCNDVSQDQLEQVIVERVDCSNESHLEKQEFYISYKPQPHH